MTLRRLAGWVNDQALIDRKQCMTAARRAQIRRITEAGLHVFTPEMIDSLDRWARGQPDNPDWPEAARRLLIEVLRR